MPRWLISAGSKDAGIVSSDGTVSGMASRALSYRLPVKTAPGSVSPGCDGVDDGVVTVLSVVLIVLVVVFGVVFPVVVVVFLVVVFVVEVLVVEVVTAGWLGSVTVLEAPY